MIPRHETRVMPLTQLTPAAYNPREITPEAKTGLISSLRRWGLVQDIVWNKRSGNVVGGHQRLDALAQLGEIEAEVKVVDLDDDDERALNVALNNPQIAGQFTRAVVPIVAEIRAKLPDLAAVLRLDQMLADLKLIAKQITERPTLAERFIVPPFSVLDARQGYWQDRKRGWLALGIQSELGRGENLIGRSVYDIAALLVPGKYADGKKFVDDLRAAGKTDQEIVAEMNARFGKIHQAVPGNGSQAPTARLPLQRERYPKVGAVQPTGKGMVQGLVERRAEEKRQRAAGAAIGDHAWVAEKQAAGELGGGLAADQSQTGTSIFDPVLCELAYRWFSPATGWVFDPFAGGSVRGIVAGKLGRRYVGIDLRAEQVEANKQQSDKLLRGVEKGAAAWIVGDSREARSLLKWKPKDGPRFDLLFSCPPYADLERYSDDPRDLSTMAYEEFGQAYREIIAGACAMLKPDRFAAFVVGDVRDPAGRYRNFTGLTIAAFAEAGLALYNEAILVTAVGSLPIRAAKQFSATRKMGKTHQQLYVFVKGDPRKATAACGSVDVVFPDGEAPPVAAKRKQDAPPPAPGEPSKYGEEMP